MSLILRGDHVPASAERAAGSLAAFLAVGQLSGPVVAIMMTIHHLNHAMSTADRISLFRGGELVVDGGPQALAGSVLIEDVFRVRDRFVQIAPDGPPHLDAELIKRPAAAS